MFALGKLEDARREARTVRDEIEREHAGDTQLNAVEDGAADLIEAIGKVR